MTRTYILSILFFCACLLFCQSFLLGQYRGEDIQDINSLINTVSLKKFSYQQSFSTTGEEKCICKFEQNEESKGKNEKYTFNLADIHSPSVMQATKKDAVFVEFTTRGKKKLIQMEEGGEITGYTGEVTIYTRDLEDAKALKEVLKQKVGSCKDIMEEKFSKARFETYSSALGYLERSIKDFLINEIEYAQQLTHDEQRPWMLTYQTTDEKGNNLGFQWNTSDIDAARIEFDTKRENVLVILPVRRGKDFVWKQENGEQQNYIDELLIHAPDIEAARVWVNAFKVLSGKRNEVNTSSETTKSTNLASVLNSIAEQIGQVVINEGGYDQQFYKLPETTSAVVFQVEDLEKGKSNTLQWNLADLDPSKVEFDTYRKEVRIDLKTRKNEDYIQERTENIPSGYTDKLSVQAQDIESARLLVKLFKEGIDLARKAYKDPFSEAYPNPSFEQALAYCQKSIEEVETSKEVYRQSISADTEERCLITFDSEETSKGDAFIYIFHLEDVDPRSLTLKTRSDLLYIELKSRGKKNWIEVTENGERESFDDELTIRCQSLESAKGLMKALGYLTRSCQE